MDSHKIVRYHGGMEKIILLHQKLNQLYQLAKNLHWFSRTYAHHLLLDRVADGLLADDDALVELFLMDESFVSLPVPAAQITESDGKTYTYEPQTKEPELVTIFMKTLDEAIKLCDEAKSEKNYGAASSALDGIQEHLIVKKNLVWRS